MNIPKVILLWMYGRSAPPHPKPEERGPRMGIMIETFARWNRALAAAAAIVDTPELPAQLGELLSCVVDYDILMVFAYSGRARPICPFHNVPRPEAQTVIADYLKGPFLLDPFFEAAQRDDGDGVIRLQDLAPDRFYQSEYYRAHYVRTEIADEVGFKFSVGGGVTAILSLTRQRGHRRFNDAEMKRLTAAEPAVRALAAQHWRRLPERFGREVDADGHGNRLDRALSIYGRSRLSAREAEIVALVLQGHSSDSISRNLGISSGTVKIHRKNAYAKLSVSSQAELFHDFIRWLHNQEDVLSFG